MSYGFQQLLIILLAQMQDGILPVWDAVTPPGHWSWASSPCI